MKRIILTWVGLCAALFGAWQLPAIDIPHFKSLHIERLLVSPAHAQWTPPGFPPGVFDNKAARDPPASSSFSLTYEGTAVCTTGASTIDYGTQTYGSACTRVVLVIVWNGSTFGDSVSSVTLNTVSASEVSGTGTSADGFNAQSDIWETNSSVSGSSGDLSVTYSAATGSSGNHSYVGIYCLVTTTPTAHDGEIATSGGAQNVSHSLAIPSGGGGVAGLGNQNGGRYDRWTNVAQDYTLQPAGIGSGIGHTTGTGTETITAVLPAAQTR